MQSEILFIFCSLSIFLYWKNILKPTFWFFCRTLHVYPWPPEVPKVVLRCSTLHVYLHKYLSRSWNSRICSLIDSNWLNVSKTTAFQTRELYTTSQKPPSQTYYFIFEIEADIISWRDAWFWECLKDLLGVSFID